MQFDYPRVSASSGEATFVELAAGEIIPSVTHRRDGRGPQIRTDISAAMANFSPLLAKRTPVRFKHRVGEDKRCPVTTISHSEFGEVVGTQQVFKFIVAGRVRRMTTKSCKSAKSVDYVLPLTG